MYNVQFKKIIKLKYKQTTKTGDCTSLAQSKAVE